MFNLKFFYHTLAFVGLTFIDFFTKHLALSLTGPTEWISFFNIFSLRASFVLNKGIALSILSDFGEKNGFLITAFVSIVMFAFLAYSYFEYEKRYFIFPEVLVISGGIGNLISRQLYSGVVDFIEIRFFNFPSTTINFADIFIFFGVFLIISRMINESVRAS